MELEVGGGSQWLPVCLKNRRKKKQGRGLHYLTTPRGGRENMESPTNTWGPLLQLQEIKQIFRHSYWGEDEEGTRGGGVRTLHFCAATKHIFISTCIVPDVRGVKGEEEREQRHHQVMSSNLTYCGLSVNLGNKRVHLQVDGSE